MGACCIVKEEESESQMEIKRIQKELDSRKKKRIVKRGLKPMYKMPNYLSEET